MTNLDKVQEHLSTKWIRIDTLAKKTGLTEAEVENAIRNLQQQRDVPVSVVTHTIKTKGVQLKE